MVITTDDFVKIALTVAVCFCIIGVSYQIMRILSGLVKSVDESNLILKLVRDFLEKFMEDYDYIIEQVKFILEAVSGFSRSVFTPLSKMFGFLKSFEGIASGFAPKKKKRSEDTDEAYE